MMILLAVLTFATATAQYPGRRYSRPAPHPNPAYRSSYAYRDYNHRAHSTDIYYGLRLGLNVSNVHSDDPYLDGGSAKTGVNLGSLKNEVGAFAPADAVLISTKFFDLSL